MLGEGFGFYGLGVFGKDYGWSEIMINSFDEDFDLDVDLDDGE